MENMTINHMGFVILKDGQFDLFQTRSLDERYPIVDHVEELNRMIEDHHLSKNKISIAILKAELMCYRESMIIFLNTSRHKSFPNGLLFLPKELEEVQKERLLEMEPFLGKFAMGILNCQYMYPNIPERKNDDPIDISDLFVGNDSFDHGVVKDLYDTLKQEKKVK